MPEVGQQAPDFILPSTHGEVSLRSLREGRRVVIAFYVDDFGPRCEQELRSFKDEHPRIQALGADVVAIGGDSLGPHSRFEKPRGGVRFPLASDRGLKVARLYDTAWQDGGQGIRAIYVVDEKGTIVHKIPGYDPADPAQLAQVFGALGTTH